MAPGAEEPSWHALGWSVHLHQILEVSKETGHISARQEARSEDEMMRKSSCGPQGAIFPTFCGAEWERGEWPIVFKYTCIDNSKTVRLSYVFIESWEIHIFSVFSKFSIMNMYFLNQNNKDFFFKNWRKSVFTNVGSSFSA